MINKRMTGPVATLSKIVLGSMLIMLSTGGWAMRSHPVDTSGLPQLGEEWRAVNPYRGNEKAVAVGAEVYQSNCAGCHGRNAMSRGTMNLLLLSVDCAAMSGDQQESCFQKSDDYFKGVVLYGKKTRSGRTIMSGYDGVFTQEAVWAMKAYIDQRTLEENQ